MRIILITYLRSRLTPFGGAQPTLGFLASPRIRSSIFVLLLTAFLAAPFAAIAGITVQEIQVEAAADNAVKAKELAISKGELSAFDQLMSSMNPSVSASTVPAARISAAIESYDIVSESMTTNSYKAVVNYNFNKDKVEAIAAGIAAAAAPAPAASVESGSSISGDIMILAPVDSLSSWNKVKADIASIKGVTGIELVAFSLSQADAVVRFSGSLQTLAASLSAKGYNVMQQPAYWVIRK